MADSRHLGAGYPTIIEGRSFLVCTEAQYKEASDQLSGEWFAWIFFAYDGEMCIYPADAVPAGVATQKSIAGESAASEDAARAAVERKLWDVIQTKNLDGTGFYSPPGDFIYPQELPARTKRG